MHSMLDLGQRTVQGCRLARTGGAGDQDDAVRQLDQTVELAIDLLVHAQPAQRKIHAVLVQDAHHNSLPMQHGNHRNADIDLAT